MLQNMSFIEGKQTSTIGPVLTESNGMYDDYIYKMCSVNPSINKTTKTFIRLPLLL